jgi:SAM-dependent methyltransferase
VWLAQALPGGTLYRCRRCQLKFRHPALDPAQYERLYDNAATTSWSVDAVRLDWDLIADLIRERLPQGGSVLDFGCYTGGLLARMDARLDRYGVEVNHAAAAVAGTRSGAQVWTSPDLIPPALRFDVVIAADVVEHLGDPTGLIARLCALLADDGVLVLTTGDADNRLWNRFGANWWYCYYPEHVAFLSAAWLRYVCPAQGWTLVRCETFRYRALPPLRRLLETVLTYGYGWFPATYLYVGDMLARLIGRPGLYSPPGNGVGDDHLCIVIGRDATRP